MDMEKVYEKRVSDLKVDKEEVIKSIREGQATLQTAQNDLNELITERVTIDAKIGECEKFLRLIKEEKAEKKPK